MRSSALASFVLAPCFLAFGELTPVSAQEEERRWDAGFRLGIVTGTGEPTNDIPGYGLYGRYRFGDRWSLGFGADFSDEFDVERTAELVGLVQDPAVEDIDSKGSSQGLGVWVERRYRGDERRLQWFWTAGIGFVSVDVEDQSGPLAGGGTFDVTVDAGSELVASAGLGLRVRLGERFLFEPVLRLDQHFAEWDLTDRVSGATGSIDDYLLKGVSVGFSYRF